MEGIKKKIVFTVTNDLSYDQRMIRICNSLSDAGYDVTLTGRKRTDSKPLADRKFRQKRLFCYFRKGKLFYLEYNIRLFFFLLITKADIHGAIDTDTLLPNMLVAKIRSRILTFDAHEYFTEVPEVAGRKLVKNIWALVEKACVPQSKLCITVSPKLAKEFSKRWQVPFAVIRNVPRTQIISEREQHNTFRIIYQGDLNEGRGLEPMLEVMKEINAELFIAGDGPMRKHIEQLILANDIGRKVRMMGYLDTNELARVTASANLGLNLLENKGLSYYYSLSNKFFNYIHARIPQVCSPFPEYLYVHEQFPICAFSAYDATSLKTVIDRLMHSQEEMDKMRKACHEAASIYHWEKEEQQLIELYDAI